MRILKNLMNFFFFAGVFALLVFLLVPQVEKELPQGVFYKKDVPLPTNLHPTVEKRKDQLVEKIKRAGINIMITEGHRSVEKQDKLYEQGRSSSGQIVTHARGGESYHNYGLAIDFALEHEDGRIIWDTEYDGNGNGKSDWVEIAEAAKGLGFEWGGDWGKFKDYPHLQMDFGLSIRELKRGKRPKVDEYADEE
ncbi:M15 family metallopeptidase [Halobacillus litoralis]|uniref:M15 family metallopeptidase n=1 Tax=Halobacillus litoralis TaxID=45668 RepID=UPI001CFD050B|nr:M15 family metallopeptidase [Halobacillus litoralis]WLR47875.1 M15 family metallopeptidase [Halobacillus litoralis]